MLSSLETIAGNNIDAGRAILVDTDIKAGGWIRSKGDIEPNILSFYYVEAGDKVSTKRTEKDFKAIKQKIKDVIKNIKKGNFKATPGMHCKWCDYNTLCPFAKKI